MMRSALVRRAVAAKRSVYRATLPQVRCVSSDGEHYQDKSEYYFDAKSPKYALGKHRSNALEMISKQPIIEVEGEMAICDGGGGAMGHPIEYISLERPGEVVSCIYCGLRYKSKSHH